MKGVLLLVIKVKFVFEGKRQLLKHGVGDEVYPFFKRRFLVLYWKLADDLANDYTELVLRALNARLP